jgi:hypothetical protein
MSLYRIIEKPSGFRVERLSYDRVLVELQPWALWLRQEGHPEERCSFYDGERLALLIAMKLLGEDGSTPEQTHPPTPLPRAVREARTIRTDVGLQRLRLLAQVDPAVHQVQLIALRIAGRVPSLAQEAALFREPYILKDILTYRAAAIAFAYLQSDLWRPPVRGAEEGEAPEERDMEASEAPVQELLGAMADWRGLFSPDGRPYRSLNRTLMNLPPDVPPELVCQLSRIRLERPVLDWLELTTLMLYVSATDTGPPEAGLTRFRIFHHATAAEIADAVRRIGTCTNRALHPERPDDLRFVIRYLCDHPEPYHGNLPGLADRVIRWHQRAHERERLERRIDRLGGHNQAAVRPPIPLPAVPGVTFLGTVGEIVEEGARMHHCIATRAEDALHGRCYLFHIDHQGERASIEVSPEGGITQAQGPHNTDNVAVSWGAALLRAWGASLGVQKVIPSAAPVRRTRRARAPDPNQLALAF